MGNKGKGRLIKWIIVLGDFICINLSFFLSYLVLPEIVIASFDWRIGWALLNISYVPVVYAFGEVYNERITYIDLLLSKTLKSLIVFVLIFVIASFALISFKGTSDIMEENQEIANFEEFDDYETMIVPC